VALAELSGDSHLDVLVGHQLGTSLRRGMGDGGFFPTQTVGNGTASSVALADLDLDGDVDAVHGVGGVSIELNNGNGTFTYGGSVNDGTIISGIVIADVDGDALPDIVVSNEWEHEVNVALGSGTGNAAGFGPWQRFACGRDPQALAAADFDHDGNLDVVTADFNSDSLAVLVNQSRWTDIGLGLGGTAGTPRLQGKGPLIGGSPVQLTLTKARPGASATLVVGFALLAAPFKGGTLGPQPTFVVPGFSTGAAGKIVLPAQWPAGVPSGLSFWSQWWIGDAGAPAGFAASNTLKATSP
jgi:hypothetical protein